MTIISEYNLYGHTNYIFTYYSYTHYLGVCLWWWWWWLGWGCDMVVWPRLDYIGLVCCVYMQCIFHNRTVYTYIYIVIVQHMNMFIKHVLDCARPWAQSPHATRPQRTWNMVTENYTHTHTFMFGCVSNLIICIMHICSIWIDEKYFSVVFVLSLYKLIYMYKFHVFYAISALSFHLFGVVCSIS